MLQNIENFQNYSNYYLNIYISGKNDRDKPCMSF